MTVVARVFEYNVAITFVVSIACGSVSHCDTCFFAYLCSVFVRFLHNHSVLLINPGVLCEEKDLCFGRKIFKKRCVEMLIFLEYI